MKVHVVPGLCDALILGQPFLNEHVGSVNFKDGDVLLRESEAGPVQTVRAGRKESLRVEAIQRMCNCRVQQQAIKLWNKATLQAEGALLQDLLPDWIINAKETTDDLLGVDEDKWKAQQALRGCRPLQMDKKFTDQLADLEDEFTPYATKDDFVPVSPIATHHIRLKSDKVVNVPQYPLSREHREAAATVVRKGLATGVFETSESEYNHPVFVKPKKDSDWRLLHAVQELNELTIGDGHPIPRIDDLIKFLAGKGFISSADITQAYFHIALGKDSRKYTAFTIPGVGKFQSTRMQFGMKNAAASF